MRGLLLILWKDLVLELRTREMLTAMALFSLLVLLVLNFAFELRRVDLVLLAPGVLWLAFTFASLLGLSRSLVAEVERGSLEGLRLAPLDPSLVYLAKVSGNVLALLLLQLATVPLFNLMFNQRAGLLALLPALLLGSVGLSAVGVLFAAMAVNTRAREILLPLLVVPVVLPVLIAAVRASTLAMSGEPAGAWLRALLAFDALYLGLGSLLFEHTLE